MSTHLAQLAGANLAAGMPDDIDALCVELEPAAILRAQGEYGDSGLAADAIRWLAIGQ
jgi:hypothetical protein